MKTSTLAEIARYVYVRIPTGSFLYAVLTNNLKESFALADEENKRDLEEIVQYCYNNIPHNCWGSPEKVKRWLEGEKDAKI